MRLLHFNDSGRLALTDFTARTVPPYAILSHRWEDLEVLFEDLGKDTYMEKKKGYRKIEFCAKQAAQDQLQYFWIDTCCIDKWNLRELSNAINSMFQWYKNATRCYVFLSDVSVSTATEIDQQSAWEASFRASKWFTRGWTLQELIAPVSVDFFSSEGWRIGDKRSLEQLVHEMTSIPVKALRNNSLDEFTASERIAWAKDRETTEGEDNAYCLLGILGISMPASYGEGKEKALARLRSELQATNSTPSIIPFSRNDKLVVREAQLAELEERLFGGKQTKRLAITGPGGTGKSQLALELAYRTRQKRKGCAVFWIDAGDMDSLHQAYSSIAQKLDVPGRNDEKADVKQLVKLHLSRKGTGQWLLIYDNADDLHLGSSKVSTPRVANLIDYLPQSEFGSIVFTAINKNTAQTLALQNIIELREMTPSTAQRMLENYLNTPVPGSEQQEVTFLLKELSYLPLAIVQAAAYVNNARDVTLHDYRLQVIKQKEEAAELSSGLPEDELQDYLTESAIAATLLISLDQIRCNHSMATECLFLAACVDRKDIPIDFLGTASDIEDVVRVLHSFALVTRRPAESALDLHRLVHVAIRKWLQKQEWLGQWTQKAITRLLEVFPGNDPRSRSKWRRLLPHAKYALSYDLIEQANLDRTELIRKCAMALYSDGRWKEAEELEVQVMETRKRVLGDEHPSTLASMGNLASTYWNQGRWKDAEELEVQVMETRKRVLGDEHPSTLTSMANLASTYRNQGRWKDAEELEVQVMETRKRVLGDEHPSTLTSMGNLASTYWNQGRWKDAEELEVQVMETSSRVLGDEHPSTLTSMANLASTYRNQGRWKDAEELEVQVMETSSRVLGDEHPDTLTNMANLASTYRNQGRWKDAEELEVQVMETSSRVLGDKHPDTLTSMANLASTYRNQGRWRDAEELEVQVMETSSRVLGDEHPSTLTSINNLAFTLKGQGHQDRAILMMEECFLLQERVLGSQHPYTTSSLQALKEWRVENGQTTK